LIDGWDFHISYLKGDDLMGIFRLKQSERFTVVSPTKHITHNAFSFGLGLFQMKEPRNYIERAEWEFNKDQVSEAIDPYGSGVKKITMQDFRLASERPVMADRHSKECQFPTVEASVSLDYSFLKLGEAPRDKFLFTAQLEFKFIEDEDLELGCIRPKLRIFDINQNSGKEEALSAYVSRMNDEELASPNKLNENGMAFG
jgi:hypothetical protein